MKQLYEIARSAEGRPTSHSMKAATDSPRAAACWFQYIFGKWIANRCSIVFAILQHIPKPTLGVHPRFDRRPLA
jgi:hypothetical protein